MQKEVSNARSPGENLVPQATGKEVFTNVGGDCIIPDRAMELTAPLRFEPLFMERVWGGRQLEQLYGKRLPQGARIGESWELVDREEAQSVVHDGPLQGTTLRDLWKHHRAEIFGEGLPDSERFPLLIKLLDAQDRLSLQVHPPAAVSAVLGGEPKTEMWYFADTRGDADIFAGLRNGVTRDTFQAALEDGSVADQVHRLTVKKGDAIFIPSGRVHAIGAGSVIVEVQQNSDTTYRVFDWHRAGLDGKPRELHVDESMASIDFSDVEPRLSGVTNGNVVRCDLFQVDKLELSTKTPVGTTGRFAILCVLEGSVECGTGTFAAGEIFLVPASPGPWELRPVSGLFTALQITIP